jgi:hypothetical protein
MSTWISRAPIFGIFVLSLGLGGCVPGDGGFTTPRASAVLGGTVKVGLPRGYCIDRRAGREADDTAVIVMGRCRTDVDAAPAVLTTAIGPTASGGVLDGGGAALAAYFTSDAGRAALSRTGRASDVAILQAKTVGAAFLLRIADRNAGTYWRGVESVAGRLVTVTVNIPDGTDSAGEALLTDALRLTRLANGTPN